jgi:GH35 family endo-1,4-beta-xylanase
MRPSLWYQICGREFIEKAFQWHMKLIQCILFYNDYNEIDPVKREKIIRLIKDLKAKGVPISGVGLQGHWASMSHQKNNWKVLERFFYAWPYYADNRIGYFRLSKRT